MKIIGIGLNKTGTTTLGACLKIWGLSHLAFSESAFDLWQRNEIPELLEMAEAFESFEDWPWPLVYRPFDEKFPGSKFILTLRSSADIWFASLCKHADRTGPTRFREAIYGYAMPHDHKDRHIQIYEDHLAAVRSYFAHRPGDLLEVCWENGDGWEELARFLGYRTPTVPFPHMNRSPTEPTGFKRWLPRGLQRARGR
ncbi:MAG: hypothetical protein EPN40_09640 [Rhodanobacteraceae bacterium]|nr:MAG: hypothetical protein EPN40_09640 [Rhodanobacteraceae bacterium]